MYKEEGCIKREEYMYKRGMHIKREDMYKGEGEVYV